MVEGGSNNMYTLKNNCSPWRLRDDQDKPNPRTIYRKRRRYKLEHLLLLEDAFGL